VNNVDGTQMAAKINGTFEIDENSFEFLATARNNLQIFGFIEGAIQNEYQPYPIGFGFGLTQVSVSSILSATIGFGRGDPLSAAKLHIKFSSRL